MFLTKLKIATAVLLAVGIAGTGVGTLTHQVLGQNKGDSQPVSAVDSEKKTNPKTNPAAGADAKIVGPFKEGWKKTYPISLQRHGKGDQYVAWVEKGWLQVQRKTGAGKVDWHIVLARATDATAPKISNASGSYELSYRDGRYFIRDTYDTLRCVRERKTGDDGTWPPSHFLNDQYYVRCAGGSGLPTRTLCIRGGDNTWFVVTSGPSQEQIDCMVRLNVVEGNNGGSGSGSISAGFGLQKAYQDDKWLVDDGELLVTTRSLETVVRAKLANEAIRKKLVGAPAPALQAKDWFNTKDALSLKELEGKVILLDFWATWCSPCVGSLPKVQALHEKFHDQGLVVIAVHMNQNAENLPAFLKKQPLPFAVVHDTGKTAESYAVEGVPAYVLIDKAGKVVRLFEGNPPKEEEIRRLLSK